MKWLVLLLCAVSAYAESSNETLRHTAVHVMAGGSGAVIQSPYTKTKYILTNWHVCVGAPFPTMVSVSEMGEVLVGKIVYKSAQYDLCLIKVDQTRTAIRVGDILRDGEPLFTHGWPRGLFRESTGHLDHQEEVTLNTAPILGHRPCPQGFIKKFNIFNLMVGCYYTYPTGMTTLYAAPGSSGSAVVNQDGELVGVIQSSAGQADGDSAGIIMIDRIRAFLKGY